MAITWKEYNYKFKKNPSGSFFLFFFGDLVHILCKMNFN
jgi:hypothetical protein